MNILAALLELIDAKEPAALLTVLQATGSTPRKAGTRAIVRNNGSLIGTIGGGLLESKARTAGVESITTHQPHLLDFGFGAPSAAENRPICGGKMKVLVDPTVASHRHLYAKVVEAIQQRSTGFLITTFHRNTNSVSVQWQPASPSIESDDALVEPIEPDPRLLILGGGHVGTALAAAALTAGFEVVVIEDRAEFAQQDRYPRGIDVRCGQPADELKHLSIDPQTYIAIVNRGHLQDIAALCACINSPARYIGMMGSRRKVALVKKEMLESGRATPEQFARIHAPIGLDIGAQSVEEIAISIVAQLIQARRGAP